MFVWKKGTHLLWIPAVLALAAVTATVTVAGAAGVALVSDEEGTQVQGGQGSISQSTPCGLYTSSFVFCTATVNCTNGTKCPTLNRLAAQGTVSAKNVVQSNNGYCQACGGTWQNGYCAGNLMITAWDPCSP